MASSKLVFPSPLLPEMQFIFELKLKSAVRIFLKLEIITLFKYILAKIPKIGQLSFAILAKYCIFAPCKKYV